MLNNGSVSISALTTGVLWITGFAILIGDIFTMVPYGVARLGMAALLAGGVIHIRAAFARVTAREVRAYELGKDAALRSVR